MKKESITALAKRHFAGSKNMNFYIVCFGCSENCVITKEEADYLKGKLDGTECAKHFTRMWSPLSTDDFKKLVAAKMDDKAFWVASVMRDIYEGYMNGYNGI